MRGMIKWKPFNSLLNNKDYEDIEKKRNIITKPSIAKDKIIEIDYILKESIKYKKMVEIKYFSVNDLKYTRGTIEKLDTYEKYILINKTRIYFKNIINLKIIN